jgi:hypothetical protein
MIKEATEETAVGEAKSVLEEGRQHHNLVGIGCRDVFPFCRPPLEHLAIRKKVIFDQLEDFALICGGFLEYPLVGGDHDGREKNPRWRDSRTHERRNVREEEESGDGDENDLGFDLSHLFITMVANGALTVHIFSQRISGHVD